jgi:hypothetical protein
MSTSLLTNIAFLFLLSFIYKMCLAFHIFHVMESFHLSIQFIASVIYLFYLWTHILCIENYIV